MPMPPPRARTPRQQVLQIRPVQEAVLGDGEDHEQDDRDRQHRPEAARRRPAAGQGRPVAPPRRPAGSGVDRLSCPPTGAGVPRSPRPRRRRDDGAADITAIRSQRPELVVFGLLTSRPPLAAACRSSPWISPLAATSTPRVGSSSSSTRGFTRSHLASATFCWFPPLRCRRAPHPIRPGAAARSGRRPWSRAPAAAAGAPAPRPQRADHGQVVGHAHREHQALRICGRAEGNRRRARSPPAVRTTLRVPADRHRARLVRAEAERTPSSSLRPAPTSPAMPTISPACTSRSTPRSAGVAVSAPQDRAAAGPAAGRARCAGRLGRARPCSRGTGGASSPVMSRTTRVTSKSAIGPLRRSPRRAGW